MGAGIFPKSEIVLVNTSASAATAPTGVEGQRRVETLMRELCLSQTPLGSSVDDAALYHLDAGGKRIRARMALSASINLALNLDDAVAMSAAVELVHNASLVHDDLQDEDVERRGSETVWKRYGRDTALLLGDCMIAAAYGALARVHRPSLPDLIEATSQAVAATVRGQAADIESAVEAQTDFKHYVRVASTKSGPLLALSLKLPLITGGFRRMVDVAELAANAFAVAYQIYDDLADVETDGATSSKRSCYNALSVLAANGALSPRLTAVQHAVYFLELSRVHSRRLPPGTTSLLDRCANELELGLGQSRLVVVT